MSSADRSSTFSAVVLVNAMFMLSVAGDARHLDMILRLGSREQNRGQDGVPSNATFSIHRVTLDHAMMMVHAERFCTSMVRWASPMNGDEAIFYFIASGCVAVQGSEALPAGDCLRSDLDAAGVRQGLFCSSNGSRPGIGEGADLHPLTASA